MQIEFKTEGGMAYFPGLSKPVVIDSGELPDAEAADLRQYVEEADFFRLPKQVGELAPRAADYHKYTITIAEGKKRHTIQVVGATNDEGLQKLLAYLNAKAKEMRAAKREHLTG